MNQKRVLITIEPELHIEARRFAAQRKSNFSAFVCDALRMAMGSAGHPLVPPVPPTTSEEDENEPE
ncbi:MAG TPA: hypothetical protein VK477_04535, partial [Acidobacteriota bacterium]|nr:hypothetical protein [Acidobacteriota bacterium]